jgi:hypothetical protein
MAIPPAGYAVPAIWLVVGRSVVKMAGGEARFGAMSVWCSIKVLDDDRPAAERVSSFSQVVEVAGHVPTRSTAVITATAWPSRN